MPLLLLLALLAWHATRTFGTFVISDDLKWVQRAAEDAHRPWNVFGKPVFGEYYRPMANVVWLVNYGLWGFNFDGHQLMFILLWLAAVALAYAVGCRLAGPVAGCIAVALLGFNDIYLLLVSWKSWYTTLTELTVVLGWAWCYLRWLETRRRTLLGAWIALAVIGLLSRELAPLIISAGILVAQVLPEFRKPERRRAAGWLALWAGVTVVLLMALPSYRSGALAVLGLGHAGPADAAATAGGPSSGVFFERFRSHTQSIFNFGLSRYLLLFAALVGLFHVRRGTLARWRVALLGACVLGGLLLALPGGAQVFGKEAAEAIGRYAPPIWNAALLLLALSAAAAGDRWDRMLGAWFLVSFVPVLFLEHSSNAYHLLAFTALALYAGRHAAEFAREEIPALREGLRRGASRRPDEDARYALVLFLLALAVVQGAMLAGNVRRVGPEMKRRVAAGREMADTVRAAVEGVLAHADSGRTAWVVPEPYAELAGLILREEHGFAVRPLDPAVQVGLRTFDLPMRIYTDALDYDDALFRRYNAFPNAGFEQEEAGLNRVPVARTGRFALASRASGKMPEELKVDSGAFGLRAEEGYVFGGFLRREAPPDSGVSMLVKSVAGDRYAAATPEIRQSQPQWELVWECAAPPVGARRFIFRVIRGRQFHNGQVLVDDIFLCPVAPLIEEARRRAESATRSPASARDTGR